MCETNVWNQTRVWKNTCEKTGVKKTNRVAKRRREKRMWKKIWGKKVWKNMGKKSGKKTWKTCSLDPVLFGVKKVWIFLSRDCFPYFFTHFFHIFFSHRFFTRVFTHVFPTFFHTFFDFSHAFFTRFFHTCLFLGLFFFTRFFPQATSGHAAHRPPADCCSQARPARGPWLCGLPGRAPRRWRAIWQQ